MNPKIKGDKADLMERLKLSDKIPRSLADIQDAFPDEKKYKPIPDDRKLIIFDWAKKPNKKMPKFTNWEMLWAQWLYSVND
jgi:hypothetical protein